MRKTVENEFNKWCISTNIDARFEDVMHRSFAKEWARSAWIQQQNRIDELQRFLTVEIGGHNSTMDYVRELKEENETLRKNNKEACDGRHEWMNKYSDLNKKYEKLKAGAQPLRNGAADN